MLWITNSALMPIMTWSSVFNQALCGFFILLAFYFLLRFIETGQTRFNVAQWIAFLIGFGALELNVVYPALAVAYTFLCARKYLSRTLPLFIPSVVYTLIHRAVAPKVDAPAYVMNFGPAMLKTFWKYLFWARGVDHDTGGNQPRWFWTLCTVLILLALATFVVVQVRKGGKAALFCVAWFVILLIPVLPLTLHLTEYYVTLPLIGLAMLAGWAIVSAWASRSIVLRTVAIVLLVIYMLPLPVLYAETKSRFEFSRKIQSMVMGVARARELHPGQIILLSDLSDELFWNGIIDQPFPLLGVSEVYVSPETESKLVQHPDLGIISEFILPAAAAIDGLRKGNIVVYSTAGDRLKNVTSIYESMSGLQLRTETPRRVDVANDLLANLLGPTWYQKDADHRWMPKRATVRLGGPKAVSERLYLTGYCPVQQLEKGPLGVTVEVDGRKISSVSIKPGTERFDFDFPLPADLVGKESVEVAVELARTFLMPGDDRQLGVAFGVFEIR